MTQSAEGTKQVSQISQESPRLNKYNLPVTICGINSILMRDIDNDRVKTVIIYNPYNIDSVGAVTAFQHIPSIRMRSAMGLICFHPAKVTLIERDNLPIIINKRVYIIGLNYPKSEISKIVNAASITYIFSNTRYIADLLPRNNERIKSYVHLDRSVSDIVWSSIIAPEYHPWWIKHIQPISLRDDISKNFTAAMSRYTLCIELFAKLNEFTQEHYDQFLTQGKNMMRSDDRIINITCAYARNYQFILPTAAGNMTKFNIVAVEARFAAMRYHKDIAAKLVTQYLSGYDFVLVYMTMSNYGYKIFIQRSSDNDCADKPDLSIIASYYSDADPSFKSTRFSAMFKYYGKLSEILRTKNKNALLAQ